ncbi:DUF4397 domain-containing protein [Rheinheimera sp. 1928-s]|uniref:DUF4397 domain-containing protein n=1 Tax=Rheinheimera sp. 1928-s TaxID=3033803 RepID=UPI0026343E6F|nr:DUF4397 domain-containing protein [Rheinheimera sp. 1928-s]MDF3124344.1 DUF4397 domain-containing protein [Rheinheimera sp. 1928-s]
MKWSNKLVALTIALLAIGGCNDSDPEPVIQPPPPVNANIKVVHAVSDAPDVAVNANGNVAVANLAFGEAAGPLSVAAGNFNTSVDAKLPGDTLTTVIPQTSLSLTQATDYVIFATGKVADDSIEPLVVNFPQTAVSSGNVRLRVVHAAASAPTVDVHLTAPADALSAGTVAATLEFSDATGDVTVPAGDYRVRITPAGNLTTVVFDSGTVALASGSDLTIAALDSRFAGPSPVSLLALVQGGNTSLELLDTGSVSAVRVVHDVSDAPAVDILVDDAEAINALAFPDFTGYAELAPDTYNVKVAADADNSVVVINADLELESGAYYTVHAVGSLTEESIEPLVVMDHPRRIATAAQIRVIHGSSLAGPVDVYLTANSDISAAAAALSNVPFKADSGYIQVPAGDYFVTVTPTGSKTAAIGPVAVTLDANSIYTAVARDGEGLTTDLGLILMDDFSN